MEKIPESTSFKISDFIFRFRESSQKFVVEILTQNFAFNLSGTLFFIGLGCSLKWWYKDQLLITLLKQNLPAFSEPEQKISWETGEYLIGEQTRQFLRNKNKETRASSQPLALHQRYITFAPYASPPKVQVHCAKDQPSAEMGTKKGFDASPLYEVDLSFTPQVRNLSPFSFNQSIDRVNADSNLLIFDYHSPLSINLRSPWEKHAYHRFVGIFPEIICADTEDTSSRQILTSATNSSSIKFVNSAFQKYTFWKPAKNWFKLSARGLCILNDGVAPQIISDMHLLAPKVHCKNSESELASTTCIKDATNRFTCTFGAKGTENTRQLALYTYGLRWEQTKNLSYPLEGSAKMNGWQPSVKELILNSYLDEIPYKLENTLWATSKQIDNHRLELCNKSNSSPSIFDTNAPAVKEDAYRFFGNRRLVELETNYPLDQSGEDVKSKKKTPIELTKKLGKGVTGSLSPLMKGGNELVANRRLEGVKGIEDTRQMHGNINRIKQLLKNELQILVNSLPVTFVDQSNSSSSIFDTNVPAVHLRFAPQVDAYREFHPNNSLRLLSMANTKFHQSSVYNEKIQTNVFQVPDMEESTKCIFFEPKVSASLAPYAQPLRSAISGSQNRRHAGPSLMDKSELYGKQQASTGIKDALVGEVGAESEMQLGESFSLLNSLGITFNNLSYLKDPPVLLPMNQDASFWKWNRKKVGMASSFLKKKLYLPRLAPFGLNSLTKQDNTNLATDTTFRFDRNTMTWQVLQQLDCGESFVFAPTVQVRDPASHQPLQRRSRKDAHQSFIGNRRLEELKGEEKKLSVATRSAKRVHFINQIILFQKKGFTSLGADPLHNALAQCTYGAKVSASLATHGQRHPGCKAQRCKGAEKLDESPSLSSNRKQDCNSLSAPALAPKVQMSALHGQDISLSPRRLPNSLFTPCHASKMQVEAYHFYDREQSSELDPASHQPLLDSDLGEFKRFENINSVDTQVSLTNKQVRLMSGYIYPDTPSKSLIANLLRWAYSAPREYPFGDSWKTRAANDCLFDYASAHAPSLQAKRTRCTYGAKGHEQGTGGAKSSQLVKKANWVASPCTFVPCTQGALCKEDDIRAKQGIEDVTVGYSKRFREINRLVDNACLFKVCTSGAPSTIRRFPYGANHMHLLAPQVHCKNIFLTPNSLGEYKKAIPHTTRHALALESGECTYGATDTRADAPSVSHMSATRVLQTSASASHQPPPAVQLRANRVEQWNFLHHLGYFPGFIKPDQFLGSISQITQGNDLSEELFTHFYDVSLNSNTYTSFNRHGIINSSEGVHGKKQNLTQNKKGIEDTRHTSSQPFDCSPRKTAYNGIVVQRNPFTKDFQFPPKKLFHNSILGVFLFGSENPFTDRQSHFFGQRHLSTVDLNVFQRDYLRQLGKETLLQSNPKEFTYGASVERVKILTFSKAINSFLSNNRKYTYLLEEKDKWHLLFQEQLRTALEDTRKYPPLTSVSEYAEERGRSSTMSGPDRIKVSAPLMMARFPKKSNCHKILATTYGSASSQPLAVHRISPADTCTMYTGPSSMDKRCTGASAHGASAYLTCTPHALFTETYSSQGSGLLRSPLLDKNSCSFGNNNLSVFLGQKNSPGFTQEPLNANSWLIISQWSFLVALLFWIEQTLLADIFPALFALEQLLLGTTGMKSDDRTHVTRVSKGEVPKFKNIAGIDGLLGELAELVLFLRGHKKRLWNKKSSYGVLLTGPPGTGKTFLVRALANEAKVPVLILSAGVLTANKTNNSKPSWSIRHAFRRAKQLAPCILFIDEIDALGRSRGNIVTDINEIIADTRVGQNVQMSASFHLPSNSQVTGTNSATNSSLQQQLLSASETRVHQIQGTDRELAKQGNSAYNQVDRYSLGADTSWLINTHASQLVPGDHKLPTLSTPLGHTKSGDVEQSSLGDKTLSTGTSIRMPDQLSQSMQTKESIKRKFGPLTQLLVSMDGVSSLSGVLIIGATNRPESLDPALTRPGRFERIIRVEKPAEHKRIEILKLYSRNLGVRKQIPWSYLANRTTGLTAADLSVAMNYSSLKAILQGTMHTIETIEYGLDSIARFSSRGYSAWGASQAGGERRRIFTKWGAKNQPPLYTEGVKHKANKGEVEDASGVAPQFANGELRHRLVESELVACTVGAKGIEDTRQMHGNLRFPGVNLQSPRGTEKVENAPCFPYSLDTAFLSTYKEQRLTKSLDFLISPPSATQFSCEKSVPHSSLLAKQELEKATGAEKIHRFASKSDQPYIFAPKVDNNTKVENYNRFKAQWVYKGYIDAQFNQSICINKCSISAPEDGALIAYREFKQIGGQDNAR